MNIDAIGRKVLPVLAAVIEEAVDYLLAFQVYVERWQGLLDDEPAVWHRHDSSIDIDDVLAAL